MTGSLIICATPIGNLEDASPRLQHTLAAADVVFAEDTRRTGKLLERLGVTAQLRSFFLGNEGERTVEIRARLERGETIALVSDAGMPAVSDPGVAAVRAARSVGATISVIPGPSAVTSAIAVAGLGGDRFVFEGFLPRSGEERRRRIDNVAGDERPVVLFSAPSRVTKDLADLATAAGDDRTIVVAREITKIHEEIWTGTLAEAIDHWTSDVEPRGEFTLVVEPRPEEPPDLPTALDEVVERMNGGERLSNAVKDVAEATGVSRRVLYEAALAGRKATRQSESGDTPHTHRDP
ncbi:MAG: 16S rRNA (cytidine(1402)-2'-O)-methyltransferase [Actinomycetota bacterium]|nr:16S rRNA (cytidine(1402)-2'-O)-methyltransferase [Actinomycetota bacterium]